MINHTNRKSNPNKDQNFQLTPALNSLLIEALQALQPTNKRESYLKGEVLRKYVSEETASPEVRASRALEKWLAAEQRNAITNERFGQYLFDAHFPAITLGSCNFKRRGVPLSKIVELARLRVASVIGETVPVEALIGSFSGGSTTSRLRAQGNPALKYAGKAHITAQALPWMQLAWSECPGWDPHWYNYDLTEVEANEMFTVLKDSEIDRIAAKEPDLNMWLQKGAGNYISTRLKRIGINLNDQSINRNLARVGSYDGSYATLDLSSASDTVCSSVVECLLPSNWYAFLDDIRSSKTILLTGETHVNEMFSSMGNGFTFELESLIFHALSWAVHKSLLGVRVYRENTVGLRLSVYGDDIICPTLMAEPLMEVLNFFGFIVNEDKSFYNSNAPFFRESCGGHYQDGLDITPFYLKAPVKKLTDLILLLNKMRAWSRGAMELPDYPNNLSKYGILDEYLEDIWLFGSDYVPSDLRGGYDYTKATQLVTCEDCSSHLVEKVDKVDNPSTSAYLCWLNTAKFITPSLSSRHEIESKDPIETSKLMTNTTRFRKRRVAWSYSGLSHHVPQYWGEMDQK